MRIFIGCSASTDISDEYKEAFSSLAKTLSKENDLVFGACRRGLMETFYSEFKKNNRKIISIVYDLYIDDLKTIESDEVYIVKTLGESTEKLIEESDAIIFLPGAFGTLTELIYTLETKRTKNHDKKIIIYNFNGFFDELLNLCDRLKKEKLITESYNDLCYVVDTEEELINIL